MKNQKNNVLALYQILLRYSDIEQPLTMEEILSFMELSGHPCSDDSIVKYMKQISNELGIEIYTGKGRGAKYYMEDSLLSMGEMKLLVDAINASNFIEQSVAQQMIEKLKGTTSNHHALEMQRSVLGVNVAKADNKKIIEQVDLIQKALNKGVQIKFDYMKWNSDKKLVKAKEHRYSLNPWALIWAKDRYYLYGYDVAATNGKLLARNYRVDKLSDISLLESKREGEQQFYSFDASTYVSRRIGMYSGEEKLISVKIPAYLVGAFIDQYGKGIIIEKGCLLEDDSTQESDRYLEECCLGEASGRESGQEFLVVKFKAAETDRLLGWLLGFSNVEVLGPESARVKMKELLRQNLVRYE